MDIRQLVIVAIQVSILVSVFGFGLSMTLADLRSLLARPGLLLRSLLAVLVIMPVVAVVLARTFDVRPAAGIALVALAISPLPPLLPRRQANAGDDHVFGVALMGVLAIVAIVTVPLSALVLEGVFGRPVDASPAATARLILMTTVLPLLAGTIVRTTLPAAAVRLESIVSLVSRVLLPLAVLVLLIGTWRMVWGATGGGTIVLMAVFVVLGLLIGDLFGQPRRDHATVLALSCASRHPAIALTIASANFPGEHFVGTILLYVLVNAVVSTAYLKWRETAGRAVPA